MPTAMHFSDVSVSAKLRPFLACNENSLRIRNTSEQISCLFATFSKCRRAR